MNFNFFDPPFSTNVIQAFSWTLLHSIWQGLILAVLTGILLVLTKKSKPVLRYNLLSALLLIFVSVSCFTFCYEMAGWKWKGNNGISDPVPESGKWFELSSGINSGIVDAADKEQLVSIVLTFLSANAGFIAAIWLLVFVLKSIRAAGGLWYIHRIRRYQLRDVDEHWKEKLDRLAQKLGIRKTITLFESRIVLTPIVTGLLRPMILVPVGFLTNLPFEQVEAILLHELAHIRRRDYLVNLFQSFTDNVFFFNPAVLWISSLIREEREHCCDELAIEVTQSKISFVNALVLFQEYKIAGQAHTMAFAGKRNNLLDRVKRIIYNNNKQLDAMEKLFVTISLITISALSLAFSAKSTGEEKAGMPVQEIAKSLNETKEHLTRVTSIDTVPVKVKSTPESVSTSTFHITKNDKRYEIVKKNGEISELKIDGKLIPQEQFESYKSEIEPILEEVEEEQELAMIEREKAEETRIEATEMREHADQSRFEADNMREAADKLRSQADEVRKHADGIRKDAETSRTEGDKFRALAEQSRAAADDIRKQAEVIRKEADVVRKQAEVVRGEAEKTREAYEKMQDELINDLINDGMIKDKKDLSYKLNNDELIVNGVKQSVAIHQKYKARYVKEANVEMVYNYKGRTGYTTGIMIKK